ncbi:MAG TPA: TIGR03118 family protein [Alphaproteobacteria bacterium]|nr:TIGR03118 family protein [Alphaproteobacteria bacterium]HAJ47286.1 TIGR03118 family protein [Alphaproteobacteria bacterium]
MPLSHLAALVTILLFAICAITPAQAKSEKNRYIQTNLVATRAADKAEFKTDPRLVNAWGIAIRPAGLGGHFWVTAKDKSFEYVGDVTASPDPILRRLHTDALETITLPVGGPENFATGTVFSGSKTAFSITQKVKGAASITAPAKFLFASDGGIISAWTERKRADGGFDWPDHAVPVIDESARGAQFLGLAINAAYDRLYAADFGREPGIRVYGPDFKPLPIVFDMPYDTNRNGRVDAGELAPFNVQALTMPDGRNHIFVAYAQTQPCPPEAIAKKSCAKGEIWPGEEDISKPGQGALVEFTEDGRLFMVWPDAGKLSAPWGLASAPKNFGALSGHLLVSNFGDGTIAAFDLKGHPHFTDYVRGTDGKPVKIDKIWGLQFGNGASLGDTNALYFAAGPDDETHGLFGSLRPAP